MIMIAFLIFTLLRKHFAKNWLKFVLMINQFLKIYFHLFIMGLLGISSFCYPLDSLGQSSQFQYKVMYNGKNIGWLRLDKNITGNKLNLLLTSEITTKIIFPIT